MELERSEPPGIGVAGTGRGCGKYGSCANVVLELLEILEGTTGVVEGAEPLQVVPVLQLL